MRILAFLGSVQTTACINEAVSRIASGAADVELLIVSHTEAAGVFRIHHISASVTASKDFEVRSDDEAAIPEIASAMNFAPDLCIGLANSEALPRAFPSVPLLTLDRLNADFLQALGEARRARDELNALRSSTSWRVTAPLRWVRQPRRLLSPFANLWSRIAPARELRPLKAGQPRVCLVVHDALKHGAQYLALHLARVWGAQLNLSVDIVLLGDGPLKADFERVGHVHELSGRAANGPAAVALANRLAASGVQTAVCNSAATGDFLGALAQAGVRCVSLVHELPGVISQYNLHDQVELIRRHAAQIIFPAESVRDAFPGGPPRQAAVLPQGMYKTSPIDRGAGPRLLREQLGLPASSLVVLAVGYGDARKAPDLFVELARRTIASFPDAVFVWVGAFDGIFEPRIREAIAVAGLTDRVVLTGFQEDTALFYAGADVFVLPSREDPYPTAILEALHAGLPVAAFAGVGGFDALLKRGCGVLAPAFDTAMLADAIIELLGDGPRRSQMGRIGSEIVRREYSFRRYAFDVAARAGALAHRVSVIVPNYNYARYLPERLRSILAQAIPLYELIVLDDASTDNSVEVLQRLATGLPIDCDIVVNERNSGAVSRQWLAGVERAKGDIVWIAEADDLCDPDFLGAALTAFADPEVVMSYTQSLMMDAEGHSNGADYLAYVSDIDPQRWRTAHTAAGVDEIRQFLSIRNTIPNVSACLFRREILRDALRGHIDEDAEYRVAGDWATYVRVLERGKISFNPRPLNFHRRHGDGLTLNARGEHILGEILSLQTSVRDRYGATPEAMRLARAYAQQLYQQFGLATGSFPNVDQHPAFARYFAPVAPESN